MQGSVGYVGVVLGDARGSRVVIRCLAAVAVVMF